MRTLEATAIAALTFLGLLGGFRQDVAAGECAAPPDYGQAEQDSLGTLSGTISDVSGAGISGASITVSRGSFRQTVTTDSTGAYSLELPLGRYRVRVTADRFASTERDIVLAATSPRAEWSVMLAVETLQVHLSVTGRVGYAVTQTTAGSKMDASLLDVPQAVTVVDRALLSDQGAYKLDDALKNVAGVMPGGYYEAWDYYRIRGFDASFNTYVDGLRGGNGMGEEIFGLDSVEVLKGPSSTLYGESVLGGIVNLRSKTPRPDAFAQVQFTSASYRLYEPAIDAGASLNRSRTLYGRINLLYRATDSFVDYVSRHRVYVAPALTWDISPDTKLTLLGRFQHDTGHLAFPLPAYGTVLPNPHGQIPISRFVGEPSNPDPVSEVNRELGYQLTHRFSDALALFQNVRVGWYENHWDRLLYPAFLGTDKRTLYRSPVSYQEQWRTYAADTGIRLRVGTGRAQHMLVAGVDYYRRPDTYKQETIDFDDASSYMPLDVFNPVYGAPFSPMPLSSTGHTLTQDVGLYVQDQMHMSDRVTLVAGGRVDFASNRDFAEPDSNDRRAFSPRVGGTYRVRPGVSVYAAYSQSFRPQTGLVYNGSSKGAFAAPEQGEQWDGGVKTSLLSGRIVNTFSLYRLTRSNVLTLDPNHPTFSVLTGTQRSTGVEVETSFQLDKTWNLTFAYALTDASVVKDTVIRAGTPTQNVPKHGANVWSTYEPQQRWLRGVGFGVGARYYTRQSGDRLNTFAIPAYGVIDASMFYRRGALALQMNVGNLANTRYFTGSYNDVYVLPGSPRSVRATISWRL
jgi:iron complex outermembrane recepter protein